MSLEVWRELKGEFEKVGAFSDGEPSARAFSYDEAYLERTNAVPLAPWLSLTSRPYGPHDYAPLFDGMVPEGPMRGELCARHRVARSDYLGLLELLSDECIGALMFRSPEAPPSEPGYRQLTAEDAEAFRRDKTAFLVGAVEASRLSLSGAQGKTGLFLPQETDPAEAALACWAVPLGAAPSTHVVKVAGSEHPTLAENEWLCLEVARRCGLSVARACLPTAFPGAVAVQRFDRTWATGRSTPLRLHQLDFCQALRLSSYLKYEERPDTCYARYVGEVVRKQSANALADTVEFAGRALVNYLLGNCDAHLKNHAFLYSEDWQSKRLAPAYDVVSTTVLGYDRRLAMDIGDHRVIDEVTPDDLGLLAGDVRLPVRRMKSVAESIARECRRALDEFSGGEGPLAETASAILADAGPRIAVLERFTKI